jgi:hypothetical protein
MKHPTVIRVLTIFLLVLAWSSEGAITTLNFFNQNDYGTCLVGTPNRTISITDDGNCYELVAAQPDLGYEACYYRTYTDSYTGIHSAEVYNIKSVAITDRCDCEYITGRVGQRFYNRSCFIARVYRQCETFKYNRKTKLFWNRLYDDKELEFWGVDMDYIQDYILY